MYEILEHPADEKFHAEGSTREEAFSEAVEAFAEVVGGQTEGEYTHSIEIQSENLEALLYDFLDELIFLQDSESIVVSHAKSLSFEELENGYEIKAELFTDVITADMSLLDIKAPTYNEMKVDYRDEKWVLEAVLDV